MHICFTLTYSYRQIHTVPLLKLRPFSLFFNSLMELELRLKLDKIIDEFTSADLLIAKNRGGPLFSSRETGTMFILTAHLKGYTKRNIKIEINEDGTQIAISGEKAVHEMVMVGLKVHKNETHMRGFRKAFKIPAGVILDKIKARFNEEELILTISMPKLVKGITRVEIEEVKEEEVARGGSERLLIVADEAAERETLQHEEDRELDTQHIEESDQVVEKLPGESETERGKEFEELTHEKVKPAGSIVTYPEETQAEEVEQLKEQTKKESQEAESSRAGNALKEQDHGTKTIESAKSVPHQAIQQTELPSPPSVEKGQVVEEHTIDAIPRVLESKMKGQESEKEETSQGIQEPMERKRGQEIDQTQTSHLKQPTDKDQRDKDQEIQAEEASTALVKHPQEDKDVESPRVDKEKNLSDWPTQPEKPPPKKPKLCCPIFAGSAFFVSLIVLVIHLVRAQNQPSNIRAKKQ